MLDDASQFIKAIVGLYDVYMDTKRQHAREASAHATESSIAAEAAAAQAEAQAQSQVR